MPTDAELELYHSREVLSEDGEVVGWELILEIDGSPIPLSTCLCFAREPTECVCQCNTWDNYIYDEDY